MSNFTNTVQNSNITFATTPATTGTYDTVYSTGGGAAGQQLYWNGTGAEWIHPSDKRKQTCSDSLLDLIRDECGD